MRRDRRSSEPTGERPWWRPRWYELLPEAALAAGLAAFLVDQTDAATSAFASTRALVLMAVVATAWSLGRVAAARWVPWAPVRTGVFALAAVAVLGVVVLPAYDDDTVVEAFPGEPPAAAPAAATPATPAPVRLATGSLRGVDHRASGAVAFYQRPDGRFVLGLEGFDIQPGPDYDLYVVPGAGREDRDGGTRVDDLRGNRGTQYSDVPAGLDLAGGTWSVVVWCQTFGVPIATATPS